MTDRSRDLTTSVLAGFARRMELDCLVYVPLSQAQAVPSAGPDLLVVTAGERRAEAAEAGRAWLRRTELGTEPAAPPADRADLVFVAVRSVAGAVLGVAVAARDRREAWSDRDRAVLTYAVESRAAELDPRAAEPVAAAPLTPEDFDADLRAAVANDELTLVYQPEIDLPTGEVVAVEALVRWQHPQFGELGPEWFIELAERSDLIKLVGTWVIDTSIRALAAWDAALPGLELALRVNVSPVQIAGADIVVPIAAALERHHVAGERICIELTENAPLGDVAEVAHALRRLRELGVSSAIDDFATGYSALSHLRTLPVDFVKIDRSLVAGIDTDRRAQIIVTAVIGLALNFGLGVIAEGIENDAEAETLLGLGCTRAQGHHLGRPMTADAVRRLLQDQSRGASGDPDGHGL